MISYTLALKLKEAGFPQPEMPDTGHYDSWMLKETHGEAYYVPQSGGLIILRLFPGYCYPREAVYIPTLSEILEACDMEGYFSLTITHDNIIHKTWVAMIIENSKTKSMAEATTKATGDSAEEAAANLYLVTRPKGDEFGARLPSWKGGTITVAPRDKKIAEDIINPKGDIKS